MSADNTAATATATSTRKKKTPSDTVKRSAEDDHRRKRRNRMTQSCLNCHTSKRMCDRKRPCGRCTQLGLTGLCVYEVDDPNQRNELPDEQIRLQKRVAELESVIRELKNKPHPRWAQGGGPPDDASKDRDDIGSIMPVPAISFQLQPPSAGPSRSPPPMSQCASPSSSRSRSSLGSPGPSRTPPSPLTLTPVDSHSMMQDHLGHAAGYDFASFLSSCYNDQPGMDGIFNGILSPEDLALADPYLTEHMKHGISGHCGCLGDLKSYSVVLDLSLRLRRAAEILGLSPKHLNASECSIHQRIAAMDRFTTEALANINIPSAIYSPYAATDSPLSVPPSMMVPYPSPLRSPTGSEGRSSQLGGISPQSLHSSRPWDPKPSSYPSPPGEDSFMSWEPTAQR
ncbi:hypothetical protein EIP91_006120 [Steccherinum ochraceum]|uniref:Zn(2)-C6 fungal-type domain-containing protein n=1 Tax=Steccherinum ochraceum TaxID=92696 RepID=A0A4V2MXE2_9APHY|nr:hypothetical protein EIP91_006120 [Steccherinum ochraceum]